MRTRIVDIISTDRHITWINPEHVIKIIEELSEGYCDIIMSNGDIIRVTENYRNVVTRIFNEMNLH
jgi:heptaprenylglyceryl phosphate synthase